MRPPSAYADASRDIDSTPARVLTFTRAGRGDSVRLAHVNSAQRKQEVGNA